MRFSSAAVCLGLALAVTPLLGAAACRGMADTGDTCWIEPDHAEGDGSTDDSGEIVVPVTVWPETSSFLVTATSTRSLSVTVIRDPQGAVVFDASDWRGDELLTMAAWSVRPTVSVVWPPRATDAPLSPGEWSVVIGVSGFEDLPRSDVKVQWTADSHADPDLDSGCAEVRLVTAQGVEDDPAVVAAIEDAIDEWTAIYADAGIHLVVHTESGTLDPSLPSPYEGDDAYSTLTGAGLGGELVLVVGETIEDQASLLGQAGGIPGPISPGASSVVGVSWLMHAGADGVLDPHDSLILGQTMAHEIGHYLGLAHPVQLDDTSVVGWDALDDTERCDSYLDCVSALYDNVMFPYAICLGADTCSGARSITDAQSGVMNRHLSIR